MHTCVNCRMLQVLQVTPVTAKTRKFFHKQANVHQQHPRALSRRDNEGKT